MSAPDASPPTPARRRRRWGRTLAWSLLGLLLVLAVLIAVALWVATRGPGASMVGARLDGMQIPGAGELWVRGFRGDLLGRVDVDTIQLVDEDGVWLTLTDLTLDWRPGSLAQRVLLIRELRAGEAVLHRLPNVERTESAPRDGQGLPVSLALERLEVDRLEFEEDAFGRAEAFEVEAEAALTRTGAGSVRLEAVEADRRADTLALDASFSPGGIIDAQAAARGAPGGLIATLLGAPEDADAALDLRADGGLEGGDGAFTLSFAGEAVAEGTADWDETALSAQARIEAARWPMLDALTERAGANADIVLEMTDYRGDAPRMALALDMQRLSARASGPLPTGDALRDEALAVEAVLTDLAAWAGEAVEGDSARFDGQVTQDGDAWRIEGVAAVTELDAFGVAARIVEGPALVRFEDGVVDFEADLRAQGAAGENEMIGRLLGAAPRVAANGSYDLENGLLVVERLTLADAAAQLAAEARISFQEPAAMELRGAAQGVPVSALLPDYGGAIDADFTIQRPDADAPIAVAAEGRVRNLSGAPEMAAPILGQTLDFELDGALDDGTMRIGRALVTGPRLRAGAQGIVGESGYDLEFEAAVQGPVPLGPAELAGEALARGIVSGPMDAPEIEASLFADALNIAGTEFQRPLVEARVTAGAALAGEAALRADSAYGPADAALVFAQQDGALTIPELRLDWADLHAEGALDADADNLLSGTITLRKTADAPSPWPGQVEAQARLAPLGGEQGVQLAAAGEGFAFPDQDLWLDRFTLDAGGTLDRLAVALEGEGVARGAAVRLASEGAVTGGPEGRRAEFTMDANAGRVAIASQTPILVTLGEDGTQTLRARLNIDEGRVSLDYDTAPDGALIVLVVDDAPLSLLEAAQAEPRLDGRVDAQLRLDTRGGGMTGDIAAQLTDMRAVDAEQEQLDADLRGTIQDGRLDATLNMRGEGGLAARAQGGVMLERLDGIVPVALAADAPLSGQLTANGPIDTITSLFLSAEQRLSGQIQLSAALSGSPGDPRIAGEGALSEASFDDAVSGLALRDLGLRAVFSNDEILIEDFSARDGASGALTGGGYARSAGGSWGGEIAANLSNFRVVNRADARAIISGEIAARMGPDERIVQGALRILEGEFSPPEAAPPGVRTLEVIEINAPGQETDERITGRAGPPIALDISLTADRRLFVRSPQLDVELSLNTHIGGTLAAMDLRGEANIVRGDADLAGRRFVFDSGRVRFDGEPMAAALDFMATRETTDLTAIIRVTGTPRAPRIQLESRPPLPQDEILARVLFGRSATDLSALEAAQLAAALASMSGGGGFDALGGIRSGLGLDRLSVGQDSSGQAMVSGGRYLTEDVYLEVSSGGRDGATAQVEWQMLNNFAIVSRFGSAADTSVSVRWRRSY